MRFLILVCLVAGAFGWGDDPTCGESQYSDAGFDQEPNQKLRVVGGWESRENEFPYQINLQRSSGSQFCGAVIVSPNYALTAAHCVSGSSASNVFSVLGAHTRSGSEGNRVGTSNIIVHEDYSSSTIENDVAILEFDTTQSWDDTQRPACKPTSNYYGNQCVVSGWGTTSPGGSSASELRYTVTDIISLDECRQTGYNPGSILDGMLCAGDVENGGRDACQGDSGGPLTVKIGGDGGKFYVAGLTSWGYSCAVANYPGVYADVWYYNDWFDSFIPE
mgnify:CR=1 FL=1